VTCPTDNVTVGAFAAWPCKSEVAGCTSPEGVAQEAKIAVQSTHFEFMDQI
jgi:hypothetical protein